MHFADGLKARPFRNRCLIQGSPNYAFRRHTAANQ